MFLLEPDQRLVVGEERRRRHQPVQSQKHFHQLLHYALRPHATQVNIYIFIYMEALHNLKLNSSVTCSASLCFPQLDWQTRLPARGPVCPDGRHWHRGARCRRRRRRHQKRDERGRRVVSAGFWLDGVCCARLPRVSAQLLLCLTTLTALCACSPPPPSCYPSSQLTIWSIPLSTKSLCFAHVSNELQCAGALGLFQKTSVQDFWYLEE